VLVLGLETTTPQSSVCLANDRGIVATASLARGQAHGEFLAPAIAFCLERAELTMRDLNGIAVSLGPGLYTGMRVGIATAQTLAHARRLPVVGLASLDLLAFGVSHVRRLICSVIDARRGELFWAFYRSAPGGVQRTAEFRVGPASKLAGELEANPGDVLAVGDGALANRALLESTGTEIASPLFAHPSAAALCELALPRFVREETQRAEDLRPVYLRRPDARIGWKQRGALRGGKASEPAASAGGERS
jgi:tRNA threonylcarbamoyladenosine biosynthesis protein TsaB